MGKLIEKKMLMYELGKQTGRSSVQISRIVNGHSKGSMDFWEKAAIVLECNVSDIVE